MDLLEHLQAEYKRVLTESDHPDARILSEDCDPFVEFARDYLRKHPPQQVNYPQGGLGVTLGNQVQVLIAPEDNVAASSGGMQPSGAVPITGAETIKDMQKFDPANQQQFEQVEGSKDMSQGSGPVDYKLPQPRK